MRYWDTSAVIPLLIEEASTDRLRALLSADPSIATWWGTEVESVSALARSERERKITAEVLTIALRRLADIRSLWHEVCPTAQVRETAKRMLRVHPLRAADALHLAAAVVISRQEPHAWEFVCLDERLRNAAAREGFVVVG